MTKNIFSCENCHMWIIAEEEHICQLKDIKYIGQTLIDNKLYITSMSKNGFDWVNIDPIPIKPSDESLRSDKNGENRRRFDRTVNRYIFIPDIKRWFCYYNTYSLIV